MTTWTSKPNLAATWVNSHIIRHNSIEEGIIQTAKDYEAIVIGATEQSIYPQFLFGNIPETVAKQSDQPVIVVKRYHAVKALVGRMMGE